MNALISFPGNGDLYDHDAKDDHQKDLRRNHAEADKKDHEVNKEDHEEAIHQENNQEDNHHKVRIGQLFCLKWNHIPRKAS